MEAKECLKLLREIKDVAFSTAGRAGEPQSRIIDVMLVEDETLYFCTSRGKDFYRQLMEDGRVAVVGMNQKFQMIRLNGKARKLPEQKIWIDRIFDKNKTMNDVYPGESRYVLEPFCIDAETAEFFDLGCQPIYRESFVFGENHEKKKGFCISENCIECGSCARECPQSCIDEGPPYRIRQHNCLHCGLCVEVCPVGAVEKNI